MYENNDFNQMLVFLIIYVLKKNTDCNHPMNAHEITKEINKLMESEIANEKTVLRRLQTMYSFFYEKEFFKKKKPVNILLKTIFAKTKKINILKICLLT